MERAALDAREQLESSVENSYFSLICDSSGGKVRQRDKERDGVTEGLESARQR